MPEPALAEMCSRAQEISLNITTDLLRFLHQLQIAPSAETLRSLEDRTVRIQEFRNHIDSSFLQLADLCSQIHTVAPNADEECAQILAQLNTSSPNGVRSENKTTSASALFDKALIEHRENTVDYFTLKAEIDIVNREIGQLIEEFRNILLVVDSSERATVLTDGLIEKKN